MAETLKAPRLDMLDARALEAFALDDSFAVRIERGIDLLTRNPESWKRSEAQVQNFSLANHTRRNTSPLTGDILRLKTSAMWNEISRLILNLLGVVSALGIIGATLFLLMAILGFIPHP